MFAARNTRNELDEWFSSVRKDSYEGRVKVAFSENELDEPPQLHITHKWSGLNSNEPKPGPEPTPYSAEDHNIGLQMTLQFHRGTNRKGTQPAAARPNQKQRDTGGDIQQLKYQLQ